jgi:DNA-binding transcriptional LysR family regulator
MTDLRDLECLLALARHRHFARAAQECGLSQPAFSMRIRNLEERLDTAIVKRGNRFQGLTAAGEAVAAHARLILDQVRAMEQEVGAQGGEVTGSLTLGVIPTASAYAAHAAYRLRRTHPDIRLRIESATSLAIQQGMIDGTLDAGITYTEGVSGDMFRIDPLYGESYVLLAPAALVAPGATEISWKDAAALPLTLLEPGMQNRRIPRCGRAGCRRSRRCARCCWPRSDKFLLSCIPHPVFDDTKGKMQLARQRQERRHPGRNRWHRWMARTVSGNRKAPVAAGRRRKGGRSMMQPRPRCVVCWATGRVGAIC